MVWCLIWQLLGGEDEDESNGDSKFTFLHDQPDKNDSESEKSSDEHSSSFAFLNLSSASPQESVTKDKVVDTDGTGDIGSTAEPHTQPTEKQTQPTQKAETSNIRTKPLPKSAGGRAVGRQAPPTGANKKKKWKAFRPGGVQQTEQTDGEVPSIATSNEKLTTSEEKLIATSEEELATTSQVDGETPSVFTSNVGKPPSVSEDDVEDTKQASVKSEDCSQTQNLVDDEIKEERSQVEESVIDCITMETQEEATKNQAVPADVGSPANVDTLAEGVVSAETLSEPVALDTVDESQALEEVFGNYRIELSGEDSLAALLQSYESNVKKIRFVVVIEGRGGEGWGGVGWGGVVALSSLSLGIFVSCGGSDSFVMHT